MIKRSSTIKLITFALISLLVSQSLSAQQTTVTMHADQKGGQISKHIYGHFAEHLGRCIYDGFYVGDTSSIPNTAGVRNDIIAALKNLNIPNLRWPGGCFADRYHWKDGVGPKESRPSIVNTTWGGVTEDNSFGTHDFLNMCKLLNTEPYLAGNTGSGTVQELSDWVQYVNFEGRSPMSDLRVKNGQAKPWNVKFWGVGNEAWGCGGNMTPEYYVGEYRKFATFMEGRDLYKVASGANVDDYHWTETLMKGIPLNMMNGIALHHYSFPSWEKKGPAVGFTEQQYFETMKTALRMDELITKHAAIMDKYDPNKKIGLIVDEWGGWFDVEAGTNPGFLYQQNTMRDAMIAGATLNIFNNHNDRVKIANLAQCVNVLQAVILTNKEKMLLSPTYHVMEMYKVHQDATMIPLELKSDDYVFGTEKLPAVSASASKDAKGVTHLSVVNINSKNSEEIEIDITGQQYKSVSGRILTSAKVDDHNTFEKPDQVKPAVYKAASLKGGKLKVKVPPFSVIVLTLI